MYRKSDKSENIFHCKKKLENFESNNKTIALNILYVPYNTDEIIDAYKSKHSLKSKSQVILLIITDGEKAHYLGIKTLSALLRGITSENKGHFYCLNCFHSFGTENKLKSMKMYVKIMIIVMWKCPIKLINY